MKTQARLYQEDNATWHWLSNRYLYGIETPDRRRHLYGRRKQAQAARRHYNATGELLHVTDSAAGPGR